MRAAVVDLLAAFLDRVALPSVLLRRTVAVMLRRKSHHAGLFYDSRRTTGIVSYASVEIFVYICPFDLSSGLWPSVL